MSVDFPADLASVIAEAARVKYNVDTSFMDTINENVKLGKKKFSYPNFRVEHVDSSDLVHDPDLTLPTSLDDPSIPFDCSYGHHPKFGKFTTDCEYRVGRHNSNESSTYGHQEQALHDAEKKLLRELGLHGYGAVTYVNLNNHKSHTVHSLKIEELKTALLKLKEDNDLKAKEGKDPQVHATMDKINELLALLDKVEKKYGTQAMLFGGKDIYVKGEGVDNMYNWLSWGLSVFQWHN
jgi:hypothetical protein